MSVGASIRHIRESKGISQAELARKIDVARSLICQIERGTRTVSLPMSVEIAHALGCTVDDILAGALR